MSSNWVLKVPVPLSPHRQSQSSSVVVRFFYFFLFPQNTPVLFSKNQQFAGMKANEELPIWTKHQLERSFGSGQSLSTCLKQHSFISTIPIAKLQFQATSLHGAKGV